MKRPGAAVVLCRVDIRIDCTRRFSVKPTCFHFDAWVQMLPRLGKYAWELTVCGIGVDSHDCDVTHGINAVHTGESAMLGGVILDYAETIDPDISDPQGERQRDGISN